MQVLKYKPRFDKLFWWITIPTALFLLAVLLLTAALPSTGGWIITTATLLFTGYFFISPCFGYVELREKTLFIKFGFILKREIPYERIRSIEKKHTAIADSILSLKNAMDHVNIKYNSFDLFSVSLLDEEGFVQELKRRCDIQ